MAQRNDPATAEIQNSLAQLLQQRLDGLNAAAGIHVAMQSALANEAQRIENKLGADDARSVQLKDRLLSNARVLQSLTLEHEVTAAAVPEVGEQDALVYGRVVDEDDRGIDRLSVRLIDPLCVPLDLADAVTNDAGAFAIPLDEATVDRIIETSPTGILAAVYTPRGRALYTQDKPITLTHGARLLLEIRLNRTDLSGAPGPAPTVVVPDLIGKKEGEAPAILKKANLKVGKTESKVSPNNVGLIIEQSPLAGANVAPGSAVALTIGVASESLATVPDLTGTSVRSAKATLKKAELVLGSVSGTQPTDASIVVQQSPAAGQQVAKGTAVDVTVRDATPRRKR